MTDHSATDRVIDQAGQHNIGYERIVLGSMLLSPVAIGRVLDTGLESGDFYDPRHVALFGAIIEAADAGRPTEVVALAGQLTDAGRLNEIGGLVYLHGHLEAVPTAEQVGWYATQVLDLADRRRVLLAIATVSQAASAGASADRLSSIAEHVIRAATPRSQDFGMVCLGDFAQLGTADIEMRRDRAPGLMTGFADLDRLLGGLRPGQLVAIAARPGQGKTTLALDIARRVSIHEKLVTGLISLEMTTQELFDRCLSAESRVPYLVIRDGTLSEDDWAMATRVLGPMSEAPLFICDEPGLSITQIGNKLRRLQARQGLDLAIIDYLQLVKGSNRNESRNQEVAAVTRGLKELAGQMRIPIIATVQLNRDTEKRADKIPQLSDMRDSGEIEQACNVVIMLHREDYYDSESARAGEADLIVRKNRGGPLDTVTVAAQLHFARFVDMAIP